MELTTEQMQQLIEAEFALRGLLSARRTEKIEIDLDPMLGMKILETCFLLDITPNEYVEQALKALKDDEEDSDGDDEL